MKYNISVTAARTGGQWVATALVNGKFAASCTSKSKAYSVETARKDAADFAARVLTTPAAAAAPGQPAGRQGGAVKVGSFSMYLQHLGNDADVLRNAAPGRAEQLAPAEHLAA